LKTIPKEWGEFGRFTGLHIDEKTGDGPVSHRLQIDLPTRVGFRDPEHPLVRSNPISVIFPTAKATLVDLYVGSEPAIRFNTIYLSASIAEFPIVLLNCGI
jgi:hypothetical protein